jgi:hypothetical protein
MLAPALASQAAAGTIEASSLGLRTTHFDITYGQQVVTESFQQSQVGGFGVTDFLDGRAPVGNIVDAAAAFDLRGVDAGTPLWLRVTVDSVWGYMGHADLVIDGYGSGGTVSLDDFHAPPVPPVGFQQVVTVAMGDYSAAPLVFGFDLAAFGESLRGAGFDFAGLHFSADGGAHAAWVTIKEAVLLSGPYAVPEPSSLLLLATAGAALAMGRARRRIAGMSSW